MDKKIVTLDRKQIIAKIMHGDNCEGEYVLAVSPDGENHRIAFESRTALWNSYPDSWLAATIPAMDPDGSGRGLDDAKDFLKIILSDDEFEIAQARNDDGYDKNWLDLAEELKPEDWAENRKISAEWIADEFLRALNGQDNDLDDPDVWGQDHDGKSLAPTNLEFEYA